MTIKDYVEVLNSGNDEHPFNYCMFCKLQKNLDGSLRCNRNRLTCEIRAGIVLGYNQ